MTSSLPNALITGSSGQLGQALQHCSNESDFHLIPCRRDELDITQTESITAAIKYYQPVAIINTAAYTAVDRAESERTTAEQINHQGAKNLAIACEQLRVRLIHLSTDYVFDGESTQPYQESDRVNPINIYGETKWHGEEAIRQHCEQHVILRVSGVFSEFGTNFFKTMLRLGKEKDTLRIVADQLTCPTAASDIAHALNQICQQPQHTGTYHFCSQPIISWFEFAKCIFNEAKKNQLNLVAKEILPITAAHYPTAAKRPRFSALDCRKVNSTFGIESPDLHRSVEQLFARIKT
jgi:dTDP-4-dehydrorhamnose reductase